MIIAKLLKSIISTDFYILLFAIVAFFIGLKVKKDVNTVDDKIYDWEEISEELYHNPEKVTKIFNRYKKLNRNYTLFITIISIFPLLGMFGTVIALLRIGSSDAEILSNARNSFLNALTSTTWGIIFAALFKIANAALFSDVEDIIQRLLALKKLIIKNGIDKVNDNKSRWTL